MSGQLINILIQALNMWTVSTYDTT